MPHLLILGLGYTASRIAAAAEAMGWSVTGTSREGRPGTLPFDAAASGISRATHILSSIPPAGDADPVLIAYRHALERSGAWLGYLSSTGVYGDSGGAWVDEATPTGGGRRSARTAADADWLALGARVFRLPGIYGPDRSALDRVREGRVHRIHLPDQVFSRVHVDDIVSGVIAGFRGQPGAYNLADDHPCGQNAVIEAACDLLGRPWPVLQSLDEAGLSPAARAFYAENRRVSNGKAKRLLGWAPRFPDYRAGLRALSATTSPTKVSVQPSAD